jgi:hypothetical protein
MAFCPISLKEMSEFLEPFGFQKIQLIGTQEVVYGKIVYVPCRGENFRLSLRIYTAINPTGESRKIGSDAIRVQLYWMYNGQPAPVGKSQKCLRVPTWRANLQKAIHAHSDSRNFSVCPKCNRPLVIRHRKSDKTEFWGCISYFETGCLGK